MRVALVHDFLTQDGGAERVLESLSALYPEAPIYCLVYDREKLGERFADRRIITSYIQKLPGGIRHYQAFLPFMPSAIERFDFSDYDVVISSASAFAKGIITGERTLHICYCHTPTRYLWSDTANYLNTLSYPRVVKFLVQPLLVRLRLWDRLAADRPDVMVANSREVSRRIKKYYRRNAPVIYPPVVMEQFLAASRTSGKYFLTGGRLVGYKRFDIVVAACTRLRLPLYVFGSGPERRRLEHVAGSTVQFLGYVNEARLRQLYAACRAFIHPQIEDFGITAVEAMAAGAPVIAYGAGGALETVREGVSGTFFTEQSWEALADRLARFRPEDYTAATIREEAKTFAAEHFVQKFTQLQQVATEKLV